MRVCLILAFLFMRMFSFATVADDLRLLVYSSKEGLINDKVNVILQDHTGFIWIGTENGISRFDGRYFKNYSSGNYDRVVYLYEDSDSLLWLGTNHGLLYMEKSRDGLKTLFSQQNSTLDLSQMIITAITESSNGDLIISTMSNGIYFIQKEKDIQKATFTNFLPGGQHSVFDMKKDVEGNIWMISPSMLIKYNPNHETFTEYPFTDKLISPYTLAMGIWINGSEIWLSSNTFGLVYFDKILNDFNHTPFEGSNEELTSTNVESVAFLQNEIWIATDGGGINVYNKQNQEFRYYKKKEFSEDGLPSNGISYLFKDREENLWIGTTQFGFSLYNPRRRQFGLLKHNPLDSYSLSSDLVMSVYQDNNGTLWFGTDGFGLNKLNADGSITVYNTEKNNFSSDVIVSICGDNDNNLWLGTYSGGLIRFNPKTLRTKVFKAVNNDSNSLTNNNIWAVLFDESRNALWTGSLGGGLSRINLNSGIIKNYLHNPENTHSLPNNHIYYLEMEGNDKLWIGFPGHGLNCLDITNETFSPPFNLANEKAIFSNTVVNCILYDSRDKLWVGTFYGLFVVEENGEITHLNEDVGFNSTEIKSIEEDAEGNIWVGSSNGLSKVFLTQKEGAERYGVSNFTINDGLQSGEFSIGASEYTREGMMYFGGKNGVSYFNPQQVKSTRANPKVILTGFKLFNERVTQGDTINGRVVLKQPLADTKEILLTHKDNALSFEFTAINYKNPEINKFEYKLEGFDKKWNRLKTPVDVTYTNLPAGNYTFLVRVFTESATSDISQASINLKVLPPFWRSGWAFFIYVGLVIIGSLAFRKIIIARERYEAQLQMERIESLKQKELTELKTRFFTNISHEFRTLLSLILTPMEDILQKPKAHSTQRLIFKLGIIHKNANRLYRLVDQIIDMRRTEAGKIELKLKKGDIVAFSKGVFHSFNHLALEKKIKYTFRTNAESAAFAFDAEMMDKILFNLLSNSFKYTPDGGKISLSLQMKKNENLQIIVADNGLGIASEDLPYIFERFYTGKNSHQHSISGSGIGLALTHQLVKLHKGDIVVESALRTDSKHECGSSFILQFPNLKEPDVEFMDDVVENQEYLLLTDDSNDDLTKDELPTILIVEDNQDLRKYMKMELSPTYVVKTAPNGKEGTTLAKNILPEIIISDIMMPEIDGFELCTLLKKEEATSHIPVILLTAKSDEENIIHGFKIDADDYITKPFRMDVLKARIASIISNRERLRKKFAEEYTLLPEGLSAKTIKNHPEQGFIDKIEKLIDEHLDNPGLTPDEIAKLLGMSRIQLYRKVRQVTNKPVNEFIKIYRLKTAAILLQQQQKNISEVAYEVGFKNPSHFSTVFTRHFGLSPSKFQNSHNTREINS